MDVYTSPASSGTFPLGSPGSGPHSASPSLSAQQAPHSHPVLLTPGVYSGSTDSLPSPATATQPAHGGHTVFDQQRQRSGYREALPLKPFPPSPPPAYVPPPGPAGQQQHSPQPLAFGYSEHTNPLFGRGSPEQAAAPPPASGAVPPGLQQEPQQLSRRRMDLENAGSMAHLRLNESFSFKGATSPPEAQSSFHDQQHQQQPSFASLLPSPPQRMQSWPPPGQGPQALAHAVRSVSSAAEAWGTGTIAEEAQPEAVAFAVPADRYGGPSMVLADGSPHSPLEALSPRPQGAFQVSQPASYTPSGSLALHGSGASSVSTLAAQGSMGDAWQPVPTVYQQHMQGRSSAGSPGGAREPHHPPLPPYFGQPTAEEQEAAQQQEQLDGGEEGGQLQQQAMEGGAWAAEAGSHAWQPVAAGQYEGVQYEGQYGEGWAAQAGYEGGYAGGEEGTGYPAEFYAEQPQHQQEGWQGRGTAVEHGHLAHPGWEEQGAAEQQHQPEQYGQHSEHVPEAGTLPHTPFSAAYPDQHRPGGLTGAAAGASPAPPLPTGWMTPGTGLAYTPAGAAQPPAHLPPPPGAANSPLVAIYAKTSPVQQPTPPPRIPPNLPSRFKPPTVPGDAGDGTLTVPAGGAVYPSKIPRPSFPPNFAPGQPQPASPGAGEPAAGEAAAPLPEPPQSPGEAASRIPRPPLGSLGGIAGTGLPGFPKPSLIPTPPASASAQHSAAAGAPPTAAAAPGGSQGPDSAAAPPPPLTAGLSSGAGSAAPTPKSAAFMPVGFGAGLAAAAGVQAFVPGSTPALFTPQSSVSLGPGAPDAAGPPPLAAPGAASAAGKPAAQPAQPPTQAEKMKAGATGGAGRTGARRRRGGVLLPLLLVACLLAALTHPHALVPGITFAATALHKATVQTRWHELPGQLAGSARSVPALSSRWLEQGGALLACLGAGGAAGHCGGPGGVAGALEAYHAPLHAAAVAEGAPLTGLLAGWNPAWRWAKDKQRALATHAQQLSDQEWDRTLATVACDSVERGCKLQRVAVHQARLASALASSAWQAAAQRACDAVPEPHQLLPLSLAAAKGLGASLKARAPEVRRWLQQRAGAARQLAADGTRWARCTTQAVRAGAEHSSSMRFTQSVAACWLEHMGHYLDAEYLAALSQPPKGQQQLADGATPKSDDATAAAAVRDALKAQVPLPRGQEPEAAADEGQPANATAGQPEGADVEGSQPANATAEQPEEAAPEGKPANATAPEAEEPRVGAEEEHTDEVLGEAAPVVEGGAVAEQEAEALLGQEEEKQEDGALQEPEPLGEEEQQQQQQEVEQGPEEAPAAEEEAPVAATKAPEGSEEAAGSSEEATTEQPAQEEEVPAAAEDQPAKPRCRMQPPQRAQREQRPRHFCRVRPLQGSQPADADHTRCRIRPPTGPEAEVAQPLEEGGEELAAVPAEEIAAAAAAASAEEVAEEEEAPPSAELAPAPVTAEVSAEPVPAGEAEQAREEVRRCRMRGSPAGLAAAAGKEGAEEELRRCRLRLLRPGTAVSGPSFEDEEQEEPAPTAAAAPQPVVPKEAASGSVEAEPPQQGQAAQPAATSRPAIAALRARLQPLLDIGQAQWAAKKRSILLASAVVAATAAVLAARRRGSAAGKRLAAAEGEEEAGHKQPAAAKEAEASPPRSALREPRQPAAARARRRSVHATTVVEEEEELVEAAAVHRPAGSQREEEEEGSDNDAAPTPSHSIATRSRTRSMLTSLLGGRKVEEGEEVDQVPRGEDGGAGPSTVRRAARRSVAAGTLPPVAEEGEAGGAPATGRRRQSARAAAAPEREAGEEEEHSTRSRLSGRVARTRHAPAEAEQGDSGEQAGTPRASRPSGGGSRRPYSRLRPE